MYAIVELRNKQVKVAKGDSVSVDLLDAEPGKEITVDRVLFLSQEGTATVGQPTIANAKVVCEVIRHYRGEKRVAYKFRRRKNSQMKKGSRPELTELKVKEIIA